MRDSVGKWKLPQPTDLKEQGEWIKIPRIARTVPFGYKLDENDSTVLIPIPLELEAIEQARNHVRQFSYRDVANWISTHTDRYISHTGLRKRLANERQRKDKVTSLRTWADYAKKAIQKAEEIEQERTGARTKNTHTDG